MFRLVIFGALVIFISCGGSEVQPVDSGIVDTFLPSDISLDTPADISIEDATPEEICNEVLRWFLEKGARCYDEDEYPEYVKKTTEEFACHTVGKIRSRLQLFRWCGPTIKRLTCNQFKYDGLPVPCFGAFIKREDM
jgi:hypothetical protein